MSFDFRTVLALMAINLSLTSAVLLIVQHHYRTAVRGVASWSWANVLTVLGLACVLLQDFLPRALALALGSALIPAAGVLYFQALKQFRAEPFSTRALWAVVGLTFIALLYWHAIDDVPIARLWVFSTVVSGFCLLCAATLLRGRARRTHFAERFTGVLFLLQAIFTLGRIPAYFIDADTTGAVSSLLLGLSEITVALMSFGFVLMIADKLIAELNALASHDALTGLLNRRAFLAGAQTEFTRARRQGSPTALLMLDIDHFKCINDRHGHAGGDEVLRTVARAVKPCLREYDLFARHGGEEFVVLLPGTRHTEALHVAERLRAAVESATAWFEGEAIHCTLSVGLAVMQSRHLDLEALVREADAALYHAKAGGRNRVACVNSGARLWAPPPPQL